MSNIMAITVVSVTTMIAIVAITLLRPQGDNAILITVIVAAAAPTIAGLLSLVKSNQNSADLAETKDKVQGLVITVDGRLSQLLSVTEGKALAEGAAQGVQAERDRVAAAQPSTGITPPKGMPTVRPGDHQ